MRRLVTVLASLAVVSLFVPSIGLAIDPPADTGVGILCMFTNEDLASADNVYPVVNPFTPYDIYFVLYNAQTTNIGGVEFHWSLDPTPASEPVFLSFDLPNQGLNIGDHWNVIMGIGSGLPTVDGHARVLHVQMMFMADPGPTRVFMGPADPPTIEGEMVYNDFNQPQLLYVAKPNSVGGLYENPVFGFNMTIATEAQTWGGVKALFQ